VNNKLITILVDNDSWILGYAEELVDKIQLLGFHAKLVRDQEQVEPGWVNFMLGCVKIVSLDVLRRNKHNLVVHESNLPKGKGFAPMSWQILQGNTEIPICLLEAEQQVDSGKIWLRDIIELNGTELCDEWRNLQGVKTIEICFKFLVEYENLTPCQQVGEESFYRRRGSSDSELDINKSIKEQFNLLKITDNNDYPAFFEINGIRYKLGISKL